MRDCYINSQWKDVANGNTAFCILGGPFVKNVNNIQNIIENNFTVTVNRNIEAYPNCDLYLTADNGLAREYFEDRSFFLHKYIGGDFMLRDKASFRFDDAPIWIEGKRQIILQNPNLIKIIACNELPCYNWIFTTGQLYKFHGEEYCRQVPNTYLCIENRDTNNGQSYPVLSTYIQSSVDEYGTNPLKIYPGGNVSGIIFQLLWYMGFEKVIIVGYGDDGGSYGYTTPFLWSDEEIHAIVVHNMKWKDRLKLLHGGEVCKSYAPFLNASYAELENSPEKKNILIDKLLQIGKV